MLNFYELLGQIKANNAVIAVFYSRWPMLPKIEFYFKWPECLQVIPKYFHCCQCLK